MKGLQGPLAGTGRPARQHLGRPRARHARRSSPTTPGRFGADPDRWWFLTGPKAEVDDLIIGRFKLGLPSRPPADQRGRGRGDLAQRPARPGRPRQPVVGFFDSNDPEAVDALVAEAPPRGPSAPAWVRRLPAVNATLNGTCAVLLVLGWFLIRVGQRPGPRRLHDRRASSSRRSSSAATCVYHYQVGSVPFRGVGPVRLVYFTILLSHTLLATFGVVPLVALTL